MAEREISEALLGQLIESGEVRYKDARRLWVARAVPGRSDNLLCAALALEGSVVVKTVMHHFRWDTHP
jgi:hypothetical protein